MTKYSKKPSRPDCTATPFEYLMLSEIVEAWQMGSKEPIPDWVRAAEFVSLVTVFRNDWAVRDAAGELYCYTHEEFEKTYEKVGDEK